MAMGRAYDRGSEYRKANSKLSHSNSRSYAYLKYDPGGHHGKMRMRPLGPHTLMKLVAAIYFRRCRNKFRRKRSERDIAT
jgi:hypothetical protein